MESGKDRRRWQRETLSPPMVTIVHETFGTGPDAQGEPIIAEMHSLSEGGAMLTACERLVRGSHVILQAYNLAEKKWLHFKAVVVANEVAPSGCTHLTRLEFLEQAPKQQPQSYRRGPGTKPLPAEVEFLLNTPIFKGIPSRAVCPFLNQMTRRTLSAGQRLMTQGDTGDTFFIIQEGYCTISVERNGDNQVINRLCEGDVVGEVAVLTGEPRGAHVDAESDLKLWEITRRQFDDLAEDYPELKDFLTELLTQRLESRHADPTRTVGKYLIEQKLGAGGWSLVYAGSHKILDMPVAIKMMKHNLAMDAEFLENFRREARIIASLNHPNIIQIYDIEEQYRTIFIIMEFLRGQSLEEIISNLGRLSQDRTINYLIQACRGLAYAHDQGLVHRDIKPANLFVKSNDQLKIVDFGLACPKGSEDLNITGTLEYMAPEQFEGNPVDERTDIYSLGLTAYKMVCGDLPHPKDDHRKMVDLRLNGTIPDPIISAPGTHEGLAGFIKKACRRDPNQRYRNAHEVLAELTALQTETDNGGELAKGTKIKTLVFSYSDDQHLALNRLLGDFSQKLFELGVRVKTADFEDL